MEEKRERDIGETEEGGTEGLRRRDSAKRAVERESRITREMRKGKRWRVETIRQNRVEMERRCDSNIIRERFGHTLE